MSGYRFLDPEINRFKKTNLRFKTNPLFVLQDPVVLGFKILFDFTSPLFDGILNTDGLETDGTENENCAYHYLKSINELERASYLKKFVEVLKFIQDEMPWYFQSISGLDAAWTRNFDNPVVKGELVISCLEDISLKITGIVDLYRKACFDFKSKREVVPKNLRRFDVSVYVFDGRVVTDPKKREEYKSNFSTDGVSGDLSYQLIEVPLPNVNDNTIAFMEKSHVLFHFSFCEFSLESASGVFSNLSNSEMTSPLPEIKILYKGVEETNLYKVFSNNEIRDRIHRNLILSSIDYALSESEIVSTQDIIERGFRDDAHEKLDLFKDKMKEKLKDAKVYFKRQGRLFLDNTIDNYRSRQKTKVFGNLIRSFNKEGASLNNDTKKIEKPERIGLDSPSLKNQTTKPNGNVYK